MARLLGMAACMICASKPSPAMREKPCRSLSPLSFAHIISPRSHLAECPILHALASAAGSAELPRLAKKRFAVPDGNTQVSTFRLRR